MFKAEPSQAGQVFKGGDVAYLVAAEDEVLQIHTVLDARKVGNAILRGIQHRNHCQFSCRHIIARRCAQHIPYSLPQGSYQGG